MKKEMKKEMKKVVGIILAAIMTVGMVGCGLLNTFDAEKYVESCLDSLYKGEVTEYAKVVDITEEEAMEDYISSIEEEADYLASVSGLDMTDEQRLRNIDLNKESNKLASYEVVGSKKDGSDYIVTVSVKAATIYEVFNEKLDTALTDGTFDVSDMSTLVDAFLDILEEAISENEYEEAIEVEVKVAKDSSNLYVMDSSDQEELEYALFTGLE